MRQDLTNNQGRLTRDAPDWDVRSALTLSPGRWRMRNGHHAVIERSQSFDCRRIADGSPTKHVVWFGRCEECGEGCSWNSNGTYAANGKHSFDILGLVT